jgi:ribosomal protein S27E
MRGLRTKEWLEMVNAVNTEPRQLGKKDPIEIKCYECQEPRVVFIYSLEGKDKIAKCKTCGQKDATKSRTTGISPPGQSRKKAALRSADLLNLYGLVDITSRIIKQSDSVLIKCAGCGVSGECSFGNAAHTYKTLGYGWHCWDCRNKAISKHAALKTGDKNPFYGKNHTAGTKTQISNTKKTSSIPD